MTSPSSKHKPYTTGARPSTTAAKANVHMSGGGWVRTITATDYAWAGNDNVNADPEVLVAFRGTAETGWYAYTYWVTKTPSEATPVAISVHVHFQEAVDVTGSPRITITNDQLGSGGGGTQATLTATFTALHANKQRAYFVTAVPGNNHLKQGDVLHLAANCISLAGGTIKDEGTSTNTILTSAADVGYNGSINRNGTQAITSTGTTPVAETDGPRVIVAA